MGKPVQDFDMVSKGAGAALVESVLEDSTNAIAFADMEFAFEAELDKVCEQVHAKPAENTTAVPKKEKVDQTPEHAALEKEREVTAKAKATAAKKAKDDA